MLELINVTKKFDDYFLFKELNLKFEAGKVYAVIGPSGSGKTTLLNFLAQLETYDSGEILYRGQPIEQFTKTLFFRKELGYLFQNFGLIENQSILENLNLALVGKKITKQERILLAEKSLAQVELDYLDLNQKIYTLSGGEAQRVALAKLILKKPPLVLADEPTAALDPTNAQEIMELLLGLRSEERVIILATHNPIIWEAADEIIEIQPMNKERAENMKRV
jgi:putative ABC transport system ATP-binding protein